MEPKKVLGGAYGQFMAEHRNALIKECDGKPMKVVKQLANERFAALDAAGKAHYEEKYEEAKAAYEENLEDFKAGGGETKKMRMKLLKKDKKKKKMKLKDANKPKIPAGGAFGCYLRKHRAELMEQCTGQGKGVVCKLAGEKWNSFSESVKEPYVDEFTTLMSAYRKKMESYVPPPKIEDEREASAEKSGDEEDDDVEAARPPTKKAKSAKSSAVSFPAKKSAKSEDAWQKQVKSAKAKSASLMAEAKKLGYLGKLKALHSNPKITANPNEILEVLKKSNGSVVAAKKELAGA